jgi:mono/diheme cytochrome c family protein
MSSNQRVFLAIGLSYLLIAACSKNQADEGTPDEPPAPTEKVTYANFVGPLFESKCSSCHGPGRPQASLWTFSGYPSVLGNSAQIRQMVIVSKSMPLNGPLPAAELKSLQDWYDQGMLEK